jgi:hypothetical protein
LTHILSQRQIIADEKKTKRMRRLVIDPNTKSDTISTFHTTYNIVEAKTSALTKNK